MASFRFTVSFRNLYTQTHRENERERERERERGVGGETGRGRDGII